MICFNILYSEIDQWSKKEAQLQLFQQVSFQHFDNENEEKRRALGLEKRWRDLSRTENMNFTPYFIST